jgi:four helix bundle protein
MNYENLSVWQKSIELTKKIYKIHLPVDTETQLKQTALSIPTNIVKGITINSQYLLTALHSLIELETLLTVLDYTDLLKDVKEIKQELLNVIRETGDVRREEWLDVF